MTQPHSTASAGLTRPRSAGRAGDIALIAVFAAMLAAFAMMPPVPVGPAGVPITLQTFAIALCGMVLGPWRGRSEEHTSELQSRGHLVCRLLLEKKKGRAGAGGCRLSYGTHLVVSSRHH